MTANIRRAGRRVGPCLFLAAYCLAAGNAPLAAQPHSDASPQIATLVKQLGDTQFDARRSAYQRLGRLGRESRPQLQAALSDADPEIRLQAAQLLEAMQIDELWEPSLITLEAADATAGTLLRELAAQTANRVHVGDPYGVFNDARVSVKIRDIPYWQAVDEVCRLSGNRFRPHYDMYTPGVVISAGSQGQYPRAYSGPVRAQILSARRQFIEDFNYEEQRSELTHSFHVNLQFNWEDRFQIVGYATQPELVAAVTDNQAIVSSAQPAGVGWNATSKGLRQITATLKLNPVPVSAQSLATFSIRWGLIAVGEPAVLEVRDLTEQRRHAQDDVVLEIDAIEETTAGRYSLTAYVVRDLALPDPQEVVFREYELELLDQTGQAFRVQSQTPALTERGVQLRLVFNGDSAEAKAHTLRLHYPRLRTKRNVVLTFRDVPLPTAKPE